MVGGDAKLDTAQKKFGTASLELDGTTDNLTYPTSPDFGFGTTNWAAECFIRPSSVTGTQYIFDFRTGSATDTAPTVYLSGTALHFGVGNTSQATGGTLSTGTWYHVAVARSGGSTKLFLDGTQVGSNYTDNNNYGTTKPIKIGADHNAGNAFSGYLDEVRISTNARYTATFTPSAYMFQGDANTVLLIHFDGANLSTTFRDWSGAYKINNLDLQNRLGFTANSPRWAIAHKFSADSAYSIIKDINIQVGRTGALTPVARIKPVNIGGVVVSNATLHNEDEIIRKDIRLGDTVKVERAGDVIPHVVFVDHKKRKINSKKFVFPKKCPCGFDTIKEFNKITKKFDAVRRCPDRGFDCDKMAKERIKHFRKVPLQD